MSNLLHDLPDPVLVLRPRGIVRDASPELLRQVGKDRSWLGTATLQSLAPAEDRDALAEWVAHLLRQPAGTVGSASTRLAAPDAPARPVLLRARRRSDELVVVALPPYELATDAPWLDAVAAVDQGLAVWALPPDRDTDDPADLVLVAMNPFGAGVTGIDPARDRGRRLGDLLPHVARDRGPLYLETLRGGTPRSLGRFTIDDASGDRRCFQTRAIPLSRRRLLLHFVDVTALDRAEEQARLYADIVRDMPMGLLVVELADPDDPGSLRLAAHNALAAATLPELVTGLDGLSLRDLDAPPEMLERVAVYADVARTGRGRDLGEIHTSTLLHPTATPGWFSVRVFPMPGHRAGLTFYDVTDRKEAEERARLFREVVEQIPVGLAVLHPDDPDDPSSLRVTAANAATAQCGISLEEHVGERLVDILPGAFPPERLHALADAARAGEARDLGEIRPDGVRHVLLRGAPLRGGALALLGVDVTAVRTAERALRESEARTKAIVDSALDGILLVEEDGRIGFFSRGAESMFGYDASDAVGRDVRELLPEPFTRPGGDRADTPARGLPGVGREMLACRVDGTRFPVTLSVSEALVSGRRTYAVFARDMSTYWDLQRELAQRAEALERSNRELERFAYVASHDLQEPLRMVSSYTDLLARRYQGRLDETADTWVRYAAEGAERMRNLIRDLLAYSRVEAGALELRPVDTREIVARVITDLRTAIDRADAEVVLGELPWVRGDALQLGQVFSHLLDNALTFRSPDRRLRVEIGAEPDEGEWLFHVRDNGIGMKMKLADRAFEVFHRLHPGEHRQGTGIGLSICKKVVERHGGRIWVRSEHGRGSTFYFTLPSSR